MKTVGIFTSEEDSNGQINIMYSFKRLQRVKCLKLYTHVRGFIESTAQYKVIKHVSSSFSGSLVYTEMQYARNVKSATVSTL